MLIAGNVAKVLRDVLLEVTTAPTVYMCLNTYDAVDIRFEFELLSLTWFEIQIFTPIGFEICFKLELYPRFDLRFELLPSNRDLIQTFTTIWLEIRTVTPIRLEFLPQFDSRFDSNSNIYPRFDSRFDLNSEFNPDSIQDLNFYPVWDSFLNLNFYPELIRD